MISRLHKYLSGVSLGPTLVKAISGSAGLRIVGMGFGFLVGVQLARGLGAEGYGIYGLAMSIIAVLTVPTEFGMPQLLVREVASAQVKQDWGRLKGILRWATRASVILAAVVSVAVVAWLLLSGTGLSSQLGLTILVGVVLIPVAAQVSIRSAALRGLQQIVQGQLPGTLLRPMLNSIFLFCLPLLFVPLTPVLAMALGVLSAGVALLVAERMLRRALPAHTAEVVAITDPHRWLWSTVPLAMTEGLRLLQSHVLILGLGLMATATDVGLYRVAVAVALFLNMPGGLVAGVGAPIIARLHAAQDQLRMQKLLAWVALVMAFGTLSLSIPFFVGGDKLLAWIFGGEFAASAVALMIIAGGSVASALFGANVVLLNMTGHQSVVMRASIMSLALLVVLAIPLIHYLGIVGAAVANAVSMLAWKVILWRCAKRLTGMESSIFAAFIKK